ncbi:hypothetical protein AUC43_12940 [Hymenobacter sedentarius]|uniref:Outer membrane protein beta-barrel domain-containing protein n=1 Tax=Hymenobacter sedentarius TaxID=1411621 RepID=A0A0U4C4H6_9BACT|nr:hypothetical protein [Hymenobacter sedentarius]ALW85922.1 hypothetical protein AUC43_12940 [Hymenobacter sedentarius]
MSLFLPRALCAALLFPFAAAAQTTPPADTARNYRHQFGLTASPVLDGFFTANRSLPLGLFYQRQLTPTKALRLRLVGLVSYADSSNFEDIGIVDRYVSGPSYRQWQLQAFAGFAWQRPLGRRIVLDYGLEAGLGYRRLGFSAARRQVYPPGGFVMDYFERTTQDFQVQVRPFAGFSYRPMPRLRLFTETALPLTYTHQRTNYQVREVFTKADETDRYLDQRGRANRLSLVWRPVQLLGATYAF